MNTDYILKVTGNILLNTKGVNARLLAGLTEETDFNANLGLTIHQMKRVIIALTEHFKVELSEDAFKHSDMKFWVRYIQLYGEAQKEINRINGSNQAA